MQPPPGNHSRFADNKIRPAANEKEAKEVSSRGFTFRLERISAANSGKAGAALREEGRAGSRTAPLAPGLGHISDLS